MPNRVPRSYEEIVRNTVIDPDTSRRPSEAEEQEAFEGLRALTAEEQEIFDRIDAALIRSGHELQHVTVEVSGDRVTLHGAVRDPEALARVLDIVRDVDGVGEVVDRLVISAD
jgi:hypothetical protein